MKIEPERRQLRILHLPDLVGGHPTALSRGEQTLGAHSRVLSYAPSPFGYHSDLTLASQDKGALRRWSERFAAFLKIRNQYDVFHFNFGRSLLTANSGWPLLLDLPFYPRDAMKVMTFQGSDARHVYDGSLQLSMEAEARLGNDIGRFGDARALAQKDLVRRRTIEKAARYCDRLIALNPDLLEALPKEMSAFMPYAIEAPVTAARQYPVARKQANRPLHFVHLSTNRLLKGTGLIEAALRRARDELGITYEIIFRQDRNRALAGLNAADVFVDQAVIGWYGAAAVEALYLGKPAITYISERQEALAPPALSSSLPFIRTECRQLFETFRAVAKDRDLLAAAAAKSAAFARHWHLPETAAALSMDLYRSHLPRYR